MFSGHYTYWFSVEVANCFGRFGSSRRSHGANGWYAGTALQSAPRRVKQAPGKAQQKVDEIALAGYDGETFQKAIEVRKVNGVPVVACGGAGPRAGATAVVGTDNYACEQQLMEALANEISNHGLIAIFGGDYPDNPYFGPRVRGAQDKAKDYPDIQIAAVTYAGPDP